MSTQIKKYINLYFAFCPVPCAILAVPILYKWSFIRFLSKLKFLQKLLLLLLFAQLLGKPVHSNLPTSLQVIVETTMADSEEKIKFTT